jgi:hypothetical protein
MWWVGFQAAFVGHKCPTYIWAILDFRLPLWNGGLFGGEPLPFHFQAAFG